jgi:hypothetical protein
MAYSREAAWNYCVTLGFRETKDYVVSKV